MRKGVSKYADPKYIGQKFGDRTVVALVGANYGAADKGYRWLVRCKCGAEHSIPAHRVVRNQYTACVECTWQYQRGELSCNWKGCGAVPSTAVTIFKASADHRELSWNITIEDIAALYERQNGRCALTGTPLRFRTGWKYKRFANASLDRIDSSRGYERDNIQLVTSDINFAKQQLSNAEFVELCRSVVRFHDERSINQIELFSEAAE